MNRAERRRIGRSENEWRQELSPKERNMGSGWFGEFSKVMTNGKYVVMIRTIKTEWGYVKHACMRNATGTDIPWREKQRIKNELCGEACGGSVPEGIGISRPCPNVSFMDFTGQYASAIRH